MWFAIVLLIIASLLSEISGSLGKYAVKHKLESIFSMSFLNMLWSLGIFVATVLLRPDAWRFSFDSVPTLLVRFALECLQTYWSAKAVVTSTRGTFGLVRSLTIPLLVIVDVSLGYVLNGWELIGILVVFLTLVGLGLMGDLDRRGLKYVVLSSVNAVLTISLYKYDITHFNSVAAEQIIILLGLVIFLFAMAKREGENPIALFRKPVPMAQSAAFGSGGILDAFALSYVPASIGTTFIRALGVFWCVIFGRAYFKETHFVAKLFGCAAIVGGLVLLAR